MTTISPCRCRIPDWRALRLALGMSQAQFAHLLAVSERTVRYLEMGDRHRCPHSSAVMLLRSWLQRPDLKKRLEDARYPHPWPEDDQ